MSVNIYPAGRVTMGHMAKIPPAAGSAMMGQGCGMMGEGMMGRTGGARDLSADEVRATVETHLRQMGHGQLKVGIVDMIDDDLASVEIVTADDTPHHRMVVSRRTGAMMPVN